MEIIEKYTDYNTPGAYSSISGFLKNNKKLNAKNVHKTLSGLETFTFNKPVKYKFKRAKFYASGIDHIWQVDLVDVRNLKNNKYAQAYNYLYVCIDVFSKYAWVIPLKHKLAEETKEALQKILSENRKPRVIYSDKGSEFMGAYKKFLEKHKIHQIFTRSKHKASVVERFNRTLKEKLYRVFTHQKSTKYSNILQKIVNLYNNTYHRSIGCAPSEVNSKNEEKIAERLYGDFDDNELNFIQFKFRYGDYVRIPIDKSIFEKGYTQKWSTDVYIVDKQIPSNPPRYSIKAVQGDDSPDKYFYEDELQKIQPIEFPYDTFEIIDENNNQLLVKKLNENEEQQTKWVSKKEFSSSEKTSKQNIQPQRVTTRSMSKK